MIIKHNDVIMTVLTLFAQPYQKNYPVIKKKRNCTSQLSVLIIAQNIKILDDICCHHYLRIEVHFFVCIGKWKGHWSRVNLVKREDLHATSVLSFPNANKKCTSILIFKLK